MAQTVANDENMRRSRVDTQSGGTESAKSAFQEGVTPDLAVIEVKGDDQDAIISGLEALAAETPEITRVVIVGHIDSSRFHRRLMEQGVDAYVPLPTDSTEILGIIHELFSDADLARSKTIAVFGAKGGTGASTIAHNLALTLPEGGDEACLLDADPAFGTVPMDFDQEVTRGLSDAARYSESISDKTIDRYLIRYNEKLALFGDYAELDDESVLNADRLLNIMGVLNRNFEYVVIDLPHEWNEITREILRSANEVILVSRPYFLDLGNVEAIADYCRKYRRGSSPRLVLNKAGLAKPAEMEKAYFTKTVDQNDVTEVPFDKTFEIASSAYSGEMIAARPKKNKTLIAPFRDLAADLRHPVHAATNEATKSRGFLKRLIGK